MSSSRSGQPDRGSGENTPSLRQRVERVRIFRALSGELHARLAAHAHVVTLGEGDRLWRAGDRALHFTCIQRGLVQIVKRTPRGGEALLGIFGPGECVGAVAVLRAAEYPAEAAALSPATEVLRIEAAPLLEALATDARLAASMQSQLCEHIQALHVKIDVLSAGAVPARIAILFLHLAERFGDETEAGTTWVPVALSRAAVSNLVSARAETVIRALSRWRQEGWFHDREDGFEVDDLQRLRAISEETA